MKLDMNVANSIPLVQLIGINPLVKMAVHIFAKRPRNSKTEAAATAKSSRTFRIRSSNNFGQINHPLARSLPGMIKIKIDSKIAAVLI
jgi:hypothetical protein